MDEKKFSELIDCSEEDFVEFCSDKNIGYLLSLKLFLASAYQSIVSIKTEVMATLTDKVPEDSSEVSFINKVYAELMKIEQKILVCNSIIEGKKSSS